MSRPDLPSNRPPLVLVIDLEATCDSPRNLPRDETEIIEIGAVLARPDGTIVAEHGTFVRPTLHPVTPFCTELTSITPEDVSDAPTLARALADLERFVHATARPLGIAVHRIPFASWGAYDRNQFRRQARRAGLSLPNVLKHHLNAKEAFQRAERDATGRKARRRGLGSALERCGLAFEGRAHRGIDDARNIARLLPFLFGEVELP